MHTLWQQLTGLAQSFDQIQIAPHQSLGIPQQIDLGSISYNFSRCLLNPEVINLFEQICQKCELDLAKKAMFQGEKINLTEQRAVLHTALRYQDQAPWELPNSLLDTMDSTDQRMSKLVKKLHGVIQKNIIFFYAIHPFSYAFVMESMSTI